MASRRASSQNYSSDPEEVPSYRCLSCQGGRCTVLKGIFCSQNNNNGDDNKQLTVIFQDNIGKLVPECQCLGSYWSSGDCGGGDSWSYKTCKAPVKSSPPTNQHPTFYRSDALPVALPAELEHLREKISHVHGLAYPKLTLGSCVIVLTTVGFWLPGCQASYQPLDADTRNTKR